MHKIRIQQNINRIKKFHESLVKFILKDQHPLLAVYSVSSKPISFQQRQNGNFRNIKQGDKWGETWESAWFHIQGTIPAEWKDQSIALRLDFNGEALVFDQDGIPLYGLSNGSVFDNNYSKDVYRLPVDRGGSDSVDLWVEAAANHLFGLDRDDDADGNDLKRHGHRDGVVKQLSLSRFDENLWHLWLDVKVLYDLILYLPENSPRRNKIIYGLCRMIDMYCDNPATSLECRDLIKALWTPAGRSDMTVTGIGHAHIDTGWLWPVRETIRKCARTFASQIDLMGKYPDYVFGASQPQHYLFVKENYPALYEKIKKLVKEGRWELQGGMWVEADCNIISGESMIRQFLHGKNFFMDEFGEEVTNLWLPDVFGYSCAMPQILKKSGVDFFMTQKISWSQYNKFPFHLFNWRGIDGTEVVTHFLPENTYNAEVSPLETGKAQNRFTENYLTDEFVSLFGIGNGGGGPKEEYIERGLRMRNLEGSPKFRFGKAGDVFNRMKEHASDLPVWSGELYLELHRGTLTTQALTKKFNRYLEGRIRALEYLGAALPLKLYPQDKLDGIWKNLLMNQFHDIIPGSSIHLVYEKAHSEYDKMSGEINELIKEVAGNLFDTSENSLLLVNILSCPYTMPLRLPENWKGCEVLDSKGKKLPVQHESDASVVLVDIEANGVLNLQRGELIQERNSLSKGLVLENPLILYELDQNGCILRAYDKEEQRDVLVHPGNALTLYVDTPENWDAWNVDITYENMIADRARSLKISPLESGAVRSGIQFDLQIGKSLIVQKVYLSSNSKRLDFETEVDWKERHRMLRTTFPLNLHSQEAHCDIQYGYVARPTHRNTEWDMAKFEVAAQRYVDISDNSYGAALLNDCKYGYKVHGNSLDLNLLRSPANPDPDADIHIHSFTYSFLPHCGSLTESSVMDEAAMLNNRALVFEGFKIEKDLSPCRIEGTGVSLETVKKAEKGDWIVIRLVETKGMRRSVKMHLRQDICSFAETDLMEWNDSFFKENSGPVKLLFNPFEIKSFKLKQVL